MNGKTAVIKQQLRWAALKEKFDGYENYLATNEDNLYANRLTKEAKSEFELADGSELVDKKKPAKIKALHSSSALAYNFFEYWRNKDKAILAKALGIDKKIISLRLEKKLNTGISTPNIDVYLELENETSVSIECKFCEWMDTKKNIFKSRYFIDNKTELKRWKNAGLPLTQSLADRINKQDEFIRLDAAQLLKHALGIANSEKENSQLIYVYFDLEQNCRIRKEHEKDIALFSKGVDPKLIFRAISYQSLFDVLARNGGEIEESYLKYLGSRYFSHVT
tara:strand:- start:93455 stop:94291 length:837 start_codon:yes stop_codon:yes gene_type:complete